VEKRDRPSQPLRSGRGASLKILLRPMGRLRRLPDARIEAVAGVEAAVVVRERRLGPVEMADIVFGRIFRAPSVE